jgi:hypothetical protein
MRLAQQAASTSIFGTLALEMHWGAPNKAAFMILLSLKFSTLIVMAGLVPAIPIRDVMTVLS